jgi:hypothetical protein
MTHQHFIEALEEELRRSRVQFAHADVHSFVSAHWAAIVKEPDVARWAREFLDSGHGSVTV